MIPMSVAIFAYMPAAFAFMSDRHNVRGFSLAVMVMVMFLPAKWGVMITGLPDITKETAAYIGILLGTLVFHPRLLNEFKFRWYDGLFGLYLVAICMTSITTGEGIYDGLSGALDFIMKFGLPIFLVRIHLSSPAALRMFLMFFVAASVILLPFAVFEFFAGVHFNRFLYGYFQHQVSQHVRGSFWRPALTFDHGLACGRFYAFAAFVALFPLRRDLARAVPLGGALFVAPLLGLLISQSYSPYLIFVTLCILYLLVRAVPWVALAPPAVGLLWVILMFNGIQPLNTAVTLIEKINPDRARSLQYRLDAFDEYKNVILSQPLFGHGRWGKGRIYGRATDSIVLVQSLTRGFFGAVTFFGWWLMSFWVALRLARRARGTPAGALAAAATAALSISLTICSVDFALDMHLLLLAAAVPAIERFHRTRAQLAFMPRLVSVAPGEPVFHRPERAARIALRARQGRMAHPLIRLNRDSRFDFGPKEEPE